MALRGLLLSGLFVRAAAFRAAAPMVDGTSEDELDLEVDFSFMTSDFRYPGHSSGVIGTVKEWFGGRAISDDVKEEIVKGHSCARRGARDETYYATSFCYWLPEISAHRQRSSGGLTWKGGAYPKGIPLFKGVQGQGKCVKCSVCHNNARGDHGDVAKTDFVEVLELPSGCLKESDVERFCLSSYDVTAADLKAEKIRCEHVQQRYDRAVSKLKTVQTELGRLPREIDYGIPASIQAAEKSLVQAQRREEDAQSKEQRCRQEVGRACADYQRKHGNLAFMNHLWGATSTETLLNQMSFSCPYPRYVDNNDGQHYDEWIRYNNQQEVYSACKACERAKDTLQSAHRQVYSAQSAVRRAERRIPELRRELQKARDHLRHFQEVERATVAEKRAMDAEWLPQSSACKTTYTDYSTGRSKAVRACAPTYYNASCERACIRLQASDAGCGVVEGSRAVPPSASGTGGIQLTCSPPQPSWILGPYTYGAQEPAGAQCARIAESQKPVYAQKTLKAGWLMKKGRIGGWDKRYFVLESGDAVRSAVLRYWTDDPTQDPGADERVGKGIILQDAKDVKVKSGASYGFEDGEECFKLYHFYRDYRFCVLTDPSDAKFSPAAERDSWVDALEECMPNHRS
ncbi:unnamed protein product [Symbiodinium sp. CCMP2456]|nr:unnamed protein product [Symbiodinium sp. CCMP2456]